jgi:LysM repeat protein
VKVSATRRLGQVVTGLAALIVLVGLLFGGPIALLAFAGNPLPETVPTLAEVGDALTSRDSGQLFLNALAVVGWLGWATFALSVLLELPARAFRRSAPRLPGMKRQQKLAASLIGATALILVASPATAAVASATTTASTLAGPTAASPTAVLTYPGPIRLAAPETEPQYRVERGDYLGAIADRYLGEFDEYPQLARINGITNPSLIHPGQLIRLPDGAHDDGFRPHATGMVAGPWDGPPPDPSQPSEDYEPPLADPYVPPPAPPADPPPPTDTAPPANTAPPPANTAPPPDTAPPAAVPPTGAAPAQPGDPTPPAPPPPGPPTDAAPPVAPAPPAGPPAAPLPQPAPPDIAVPLPPAQDDGDPNYAAGPVDDGPDINRPLAASAVIAAAGIAGAQVGAVLGLRKRAEDAGKHRAEPA